MARIRKETRDQSDIRWQIALYIRLSKEDGNDESLSITQQRKILLDYVEKNFTANYRIVDEYCDDGKSGTDDMRENFRRMINDVYAGKVNCIICKTLSRAFRNYADQGRYLEEVFPKYKVRFISESNPYVDSYLNADAIQNGMEIPINGLMNDRFAAKTSADIRRTFQAKRNRGEFIGAFAPYGYEKNPKNKNALIIDEEAAAVVRDIFSWYVYGDDTENGGMSKEGIAKKLNARGILSPAAYKKKKGARYSNAQQGNGMWTNVAVTRTLQNKMYIGVMVQGRQRVISYKVHHQIRVPKEEWIEVPNMHQPIISKEIFELAAERQQCETRAAPRQTSAYLFAGLVRCADCGKAMTRRPAKNFVYYYCTTYKRKSKTQCTCHSIRLDKLQSAVLKSIQAQIALAQGLPQLVERMNHISIEQKKSTRLNQLLCKHNSELNRIETIAEDLYVDWKTGELTHKQYIALKEKFAGQQERIQTAMETLQQEMKQCSNQDEEKTSGLQSFLKYKNITALEQPILMELIECITVQEGGAITIYFKLEDPYQKVAESIETNKQDPPQLLQLG